MYQTAIYSVHSSAVRISGIALVSINFAAVRRDRSALGWVTVYGRVNHLSM